MSSQKQHTTFFLLFGSAICVLQFAFCRSQNLSYQLFLCIIYLFNHRTETFKLLIVALGCRSGDDKRRSGIVNQDRIDLIDYCIVVFSLNDFPSVATHIVSQVVKTKFVVCAISDVRIVGTTSLFRIGFMLVNTIDAQSVELKQHSHPFAVSFCQIVIDSYHMDTLSRKSVKVNRQGCNESFSFSCCHFCNFSLMKHRSSYELHIVMHHIPSYSRASCNPTVVIVSLIAHNIDIISTCGKVFVVFVGSNLHFLVFGKAFSCCFHHSKSLGQQIVQHILRLVVYFLLQIFNLSVDALFLFHSHIEFAVDSTFQFIDLLLFTLYCRMYCGFEINCLGSQLIV